MQRHPLRIPALLRHAARHHGDVEIVSRLDEGGTHRTTWTGLEQCARRLVRALHGRTELPSHAILGWQAERGVAWHYIALGKPRQNGFVESLSGRPR